MTQPLIFIVDDDVSILKMLSISLNTKGCVVETSSSPLGTIRRLMDQPSVDILILDNYMPALSGLALLGLIKHTPKVAHIPIVFHSADSTMRALVTAVGHSHCTFHPKGKLSDLMNLILEILQSKSALPRL